MKLPHKSVGAVIFFYNANNSCHKENILLFAALVLEVRQ